MASIPEQVRHELPRAGEVPFDSSTKFMATLHPHPDDADRSLVVVKGAPDVVLARCSTVVDDGGPVVIDEARRARLLEDNHELGSEGLRVLALAITELPIPADEYEGDLATEIADLRLEALVGHPGPRPTRGDRRDRRVRHRRHRREDDHG